MQEWITGLMTSLGYGGIFLLMFLENLFPPIPSELIMPLAGFTIAQGKMDWGPALLAGISGTLLGAFPWYYSGVWLGEVRLKHWADRYGKWISVSRADVERTLIWFRRYGSLTVFFGRLVPGIRTLISAPAGVNRMALGPFVLYSTLGTALWTAFLTGAGYVLGSRYELVDEYLGPVSKLVLLGIVASLGGFLLLRHWFQARKP